MSKNREIKTEKEIEIIREGGKILAKTMKGISREIKEGVCLKDLNLLAEKLIREAGGKPAFLGYKPGGAAKPYPASICASLNEVVVHGVPSGYCLKNGDILKIDLGVKYKGYFSDAAFTVGIGEISDEIKRLISVTKEALAKAIKEAKSGRTLGDVGWAIENCAKENGFEVVTMLTGHGIGKRLHEDIVVYNYGDKGKGLKLEEGMVLAIEPMISAGSGEVRQLKDDSYATIDGSLTAHFEHTIVVRKNNGEVLTKI